MNFYENEKKNPFADLSLYNMNRGNEAVKEIEQRYCLENDMISAVSQGNYKALCSLINIETFLSVVDKRTSDELRNIKNYMIIFNTLLRKGVELGNVHPFYIHNLSTHFALKIEEIKSLTEFEKLWNEMAFSYCKLVRDNFSKGYCPLIQNAVMLIDADLSCDLSLSAFSKKLKVNKSYFSSLFKKETGSTLTDYVNKKRIEKAKYLLRTTTEQIQNIALVCGIDDVNYFIKLFKKHTGITPKKYRQNCFPN